MQVTLSFLRSFFFVSCRYARPSGPGVSALRHGRYPMMDSDDAEILAKDRRQISDVRAGLAVTEINMGLGLRCSVGALRTGGPPQITSQGSHKRRKTTVG